MVSMCVSTVTYFVIFFFFFSSRRRHTRFDCDWSSDVCSSDLPARRLFVLGFCFGGRIAFLSSAYVPGLAGVVGFYGRLGKRENETWPVPAEEAKGMRAPVLGLFGGDDPGIPASDIAAFDDALGAGERPHRVQN